MDLVSDLKANDTVETTEYTAPATTGTDQDQYDMTRIGKEQELLVRIWFYVHAI